jgi:hypothetical protein
MELTSRQNALLEFVKEQHGEQVRKYTGELYWHHVYAVAESVSKYEPKAIEAALAHDLFEDTECTFDTLYWVLYARKYSRREAFIICKTVDELSDKYTKENYSEFNRSQRKALEAKRLGKIGYLAQSIKYCDLIDNTKSIVKHDKGFAKVYLEEKGEILRLMRKGNAELLKSCELVLIDGFLKLGKTWKSPIQQ